jgi:hypothetical protein
MDPSLSLKKKGTIRGMETLWFPSPPPHPLQCFLFSLFFWEKEEPFLTDKTKIGVYSAQFVT